MPIFQKLIITVVQLLSPIQHPWIYYRRIIQKGTYRNGYVNEKVQGLLCEKRNHLRIRNADMQAAEVQYETPGLLAPITALKRGQGRFNLSSTL